MIKVGSQQLRMLRILWDLGEATARQITEELSKESHVAHSTTQTLLRQLEVKGAVGYEVRDRVFIFRALVTPDDIAQSATQDLLAKVFRGSLSGLVAHVLDNEDVSKDELDAIKKMIEAKEQGKS